MAALSFDVTNNSPDAHASLNPKSKRKKLVFEACFAEKAEESLWADLNDYLTSINFFDGYQLPQ